MTCSHLFDGYKLSNTASSAHVAQVLNAPVILVIDAHAVSRSTLAMFEGYKKIESRHLGLHLGIESRKDWKKWAEFGERYLDIDAIQDASVILDPQKHKEEKVSKDRFTVGIPFDNAFAFYYRANLEELRRVSDLVFFSPMQGEWQECGGMMFLARKIVDGRRSFPMANLLDMDIIFTKKTPGHRICNG